MKHDQEQPPPPYEAAVAHLSQQDSLALSTARLEHQAAFERLEHERLMRQADLERIAHERKCRLDSENHNIQAKHDTLETSQRPTSIPRPWHPSFSHMLKPIHRVPTSNRALQDDYGQLIQDDSELSMPPFNAALHELCKRPAYRRPIGGLSEEATKLRDFLILRLEQDYTMGRGVLDPHWTDLATLIRDGRLAFTTRSLPGDKLLGMSATLRREVWQPATELGLLTEEVEENLLAYRKWKFSGCVHAVALQNGVETVAAKLCYDWYKVRQLVESGKRRERLLEGVREVVGRYLRVGHYWWRMMRQETS